MDEFSDLYEQDDPDTGWMTANAMVFGETMSVTTATTPAHITWVDPTDDVIAAPTGIEVESDEMVEVVGKQISYEDLGKHISVYDTDGKTVRWVGPLVEYRMSANEIVVTVDCDGDWQGVMVAPDEVVELRPNRD